MDNPKKLPVLPAERNKDKGRLCEVMVGVSGRESERRRSMVEETKVNGGAMVKAHEGKKGETGTLKQDNRRGNRTMGARITSPK